MAYVSNPLILRIFINQGESGWSERWPLLTQFWQQALVDAAMLVEARRHVISSNSSIEWASVATIVPSYKEQAVVPTALLPLPQWGPSSFPMQGITFGFYTTEGYNSHHLFRAVDENEISAKRWIRNHLYFPAVPPALPANLALASKDELWQNTLCNFRNLTAHCVPRPARDGGEPPFFFDVWEQCWYVRVSSRMVGAKYQRASWESQARSWAPPFSPCGEAVTVLRRCYQEPCRFYAGQAVTGIRYYWSKPGATMFPLPTVFYGWARAKENTYHGGPGETAQYRRVFETDGFSFSNAPGTSYTGRPRDFLGMGSVFWEPYLPVPSDIQVPCDVTPAVILAGNGGIAWGGWGAQPAPEPPPAETMVIHRRDDDLYADEEPALEEFEFPVDRRHFVPIMVTPAPPLVLPDLKLIEHAAQQAALGTLYNPVSFVSAPQCVGIRHFFVFATAGAGSYDINPELYEIPYGWVPTTGSLYVVCFASSQGNILPIATPDGWVALGPQLAQSPEGSSLAAFACIWNPDITWFFAGTSSEIYVDAAVYEFFGVGSDWSIDQVVTSNTSGTSYTAGSTGTLAVPEEIAACFAVGNGSFEGGPLVITTAPGFTPNTKGGNNLTENWSGYSILLTNSTSAVDGSYSIYPDGTLYVCMTLTINPGTTACTGAPWQTMPVGIAKAGEPVAEILRPCVLFSTAAVNPIVVPTWLPVLLTPPASRSPETASRPAATLWSVAAASAPVTAWLKTLRPYKKTEEETFAAEMVAKSVGALWSPGVIPVKPFALVAHTTVGGNAQPGGVTTPAINTTGANLIIALIAYLDLPSPPVSDSNGNTWTLITSSTTLGATTAVYYCLNPVVGAGHTFHTGGLNTFTGISIMAFSGAKSVSALDAHNSSGTNTTGSITPSQNNELIVMGAGVFSGSTPTGISIGVIVDIDPPVPGRDFANATAYQVQTAATPANATFSFSSGSCCSVIACFKNG